MRKGIARCLAGVRGLNGKVEVDGDAGRGVLIAGHIRLTGLPDDVIGTWSTFEPAEAVPGQRVVETGTPQIFKAGQSVGAGLHSVLRPGNHEADSDAFLPARCTLVACGVVAEAAVERVVARPALDNVIVAVARDRVVEVRADDAVDPGERIAADIGDVARRCAVGRSGHHIDRHRSRSACIRNPGITVAGDGVIAAHTLEFVEGRCQGQIVRGAVEIRRHIDVGEIRAADRLDGVQCVGADRGVADDRASRHVDSDAGDRPQIDVVDRLIEAAASHQDVVAGAAIEHLGGVSGIGAAIQRVRKARADDGVDPGNCIAADRVVTRCRSKREIDGDTGRRVDERNPRIAVADDGVVATQPLEFVERIAGKIAPGTAGIRNSMP